MLLANELFVLMITVQTWLTPLPQYAQGKLVYYGRQYLVEANAEYRNYDLSYYRDRCGGSAMSPADLGKIWWFRLDSEPSGWYGPCLFVDVAARQHFRYYVQGVEEIVEIGDPQRKMLGDFGSQMWGVVWVGRCPPSSIEYEPSRYDLTVEWDRYPYEPTPSFYPYQAQELPMQCDTGTGTDTGTDTDTESVSNIQ